MNLHFTFSLGQKVKTPFGETGIVKMFGYDEVGIQYFVRTKTGDGTWYKESELSTAEV